MLLQIDLNEYDIIAIKCAIVESMLKVNRKRNLTDCEFAKQARYNELKRLQSLYNKMAEAAARQYYAAAE